MSNDESLSEYFGQVINLEPSAAVYELLRERYGEIPLINDPLLPEVAHRMVECIPHLPAQAQANAAQSILMRLTHHSGEQEKACKRIAELAKGLSTGAAKFEVARHAATYCPDGAVRNAIINQVRATSPGGDLAAEHKRFTDCYGARVA